MTDTDRITQPLNRSAALSTALDDPRGDGEQGVLLVGSGALIVYGLARRSWGGLALALLGGALLYNNIARRRPTEERTDIGGRATARQPNQPLKQRSRPLDPVVETSEESFPASDPPAWTGSRAGSVGDKPEG